MSKTEKITYLPEVHRLLPQAPDAEMGLLSSFVLAPPQVRGMCADKMVSTSHFHIPSYAEIYSALCEIFDSEKPVDMITVCVWLKDRNKLDVVGGPAAISGLWSYLPTAANAAYYLDIVTDKFKLREIIRVCTEYASRAYDEQSETPELLDGLERESLAIRGQSECLRDTPIKQLTMESIGNIQKLYERRGKISGIETGFKILDRMTDGLQGSNLYVIAARPSMGKTAFAMNIAEHIAVNLGIPVGFFSLEMSAAQLTQRAICSLARVNMERVRDGFLSERDFPAVTAAAAKIASAPLRIDERSALTIQQVRLKTRMWVLDHGVKAVFIDYIQLLRSLSKRAQNDRQLEVSEISAGLKSLAKELNIPVVVLAQLNRNVENRTGGTKGRPRMSDLRESGSIEQDADLIGLLYREEYYADNEDEKERLKGQAMLTIGKQRNGPVGDVPLTFFSEWTRFEDRCFSPEPI